MADLPAIRELILNSYLAMTDYCPQLEAMWTKSAKKAWETPQGDLHDESFPLYLADYSTSPPTPLQETSGTGGTASTAGGLAVDPAKESAFWVAEVDGAVLGCVGLNERHYEDADLLRMAVSPASRGMGIGQLLVAQLESYAISRNIVRLHCITANLAAGRFYVDKCGYFVVSSIYLTIASISQTTPNAQPTI
jgi:GNAT superfamily N-acetyltransferase